MLLVISAFIFSSSQCSTAQSTMEKKGKTISTIEKKKALGTLDKAYFASGCFWCVEAVFESVEGVSEVISGYAGGTADDANYSAVSNGTTDHAETVEVYYNSDIISYETLLKVFFGSHDPSTLNRQGPDRGRAYRSAIYYQNEAEKLAAETYIAELLGNKTFDVITTEVTALEAFYDAEEYHQDYERLNPNQGYIRAVSVPRLKKFQKKYPELLKKNLH